MAHVASVTVYHVRSKVRTIRVLFYRRLDYFEPHYHFMQVLKRRLLITAPADLDSKRTLKMMTMRQLVFYSRRHRIELRRYCSRPPADESASKTSSMLPPLKHPHIVYMKKEWVLIVRKV